MLEASPPSNPSRKNSGAVANWRSRNKPTATPPTSEPTTEKPNCAARAAARQAPMAQRPSQRPLVTRVHNRGSIANTREAALSRNAPCPAGRACEKFHELSVAACEQCGKRCGRGVEETARAFRRERNALA